MPTGSTATRRVSSTTPDTDWRTSLDQVDAGAVSSSDVQVPAELTLDMLRRGDLVINALLEGPPVRPRHEQRPLRAR